MDRKQPKGLKNDKTTIFVENQKYFVDIIFTNIDTTSPKPIIRKMGHYYQQNTPNR